MLSMILAIDHNNLVGKTNSNNGLAWYYPEDLKYYKAMTINKINIMGHNTFNAIGRPLPNRETVVLSRNKDLKIKGVEVLNDITDITRYDMSQEIMICGGVSIFKAFNQLVDRIYITRINKDHEGDIYYHDLDLNGFTLKSSKQGESDKDIYFEMWERNEN